MVLRILAPILMAATAAADPSLLDASNAYRETLSSAERQKVMLPFNSDERLNWHFVPKQRLGINLKETNDSQKQLVLDLLRAGLSEAGFTKAETIRSLEIVLREKEGSDFRDPDLYYILFFGEPSADGNWSVRYEGHHLSFNWTYANGELVSASPQFLGANPAEVRLEGPMKGTRALGAEEDLARKLLTSMTVAQRGLAVIAGEAPRDILTSNQPRVEPLPDEGISFRRLDAQQQGFLLAVIEEGARVQPPAISKRRLDQIRDAGLNDIKFAWMGGLEKGGAHYYRVQGPTFLIEYDNIQNNANHIHIVWRDFDGDFGADVLQAHYSRIPH